MNIQKYVHFYKKKNWKENMINNFIHMAFTDFNLKIKISTRLYTYNVYIRCFPLKLPRCSCQVFTEMSWETDQLLCRKWLAETYTYIVKDILNSLLEDGLENVIIKDEHFFFNYKVYTVTRRDLLFFFCTCILSTGYSKIV